MISRALFLCTSLLLLSSGSLAAQILPEYSEVTMDKSVPTVTSYFVGVSPCRIADTRGNGFGGAYGPPALINGTPRDFILAGRCGIPDSAQAVSLNLTVVQPAGAGYLTIFPLGGAVPPVSTLNFAAGQVIANAALVALGDGGGITVFSGGAGTHLVIDVNGYFLPAQKLCVAIDRTIHWRDTISAPPSWTATECNAFKLATLSSDHERAYQLGCLFDSGVFFGEANGGLPSPNCGW